MALAKVTAIELHKGDSITVVCYGLSDDAKANCDTPKRILNISVEDDHINIVTIANINDMPIVHSDWTVEDADGISA